MRKTKIICTLGPATDRGNVLEQLIKEGMNVARFNFSHGDHEEQRGRIEKLRSLREKCGQLLADAHVMKPEIGRIDNSRARTVNEAGRAKADAVDIGERDGLAVAQRLTDAGDFTDNFGRAALRACGTGRARSNGPIFCDKPHLDGGAAEIHTEVEHTFTSCSRRLICRTAG